ncbi:hypothetical protein Syun_009404 [Stephania yunnanensis]|uniref:Uncharacterized protein n=1 Tax=Stephania yunnanensis TaxID=152371 RepID=A0AAP0KH30_9MAGN
MDESRRMRTGLNLPRRRSTEETSLSNQIRRSLFAFNSTNFSTQSYQQPLQPQDFSDVFGGPPRTIAQRRFSADFAAANANRHIGKGGSSSSTAFYEDIFRSPERGDPASRGRNLPVFQIPGERVRGGSRRTEGFYVDIFGADDYEDQQRWRESKSKSNYKSNSDSSVLSSEDRSPLRPSISTDDALFCSFTSKLRPINIPHRPNRSPSTYAGKQKMRGSPDYAWTRLHAGEFQFAENEHYRSNSWFPRSTSSPETITVERNSCQSFKASPEDQDTDSPSSAISSLYQDLENKPKYIDKVLYDDQEVEQEQVIMSSYVIEINSNKKEVRDECVALDEAIAWAKESFQSQSSDTTETVNQQRTRDILRIIEPFEYDKEMSTLHQLSNGEGK